MTILLSVLLRILVDVYHHDRLHKFGRITIAVPKVTRMEVIS